MSIAQLILGVGLATVGVGMIVGRRRIGERHARAGNWQTAAPMLWAFVGVLLATTGVLQR
jgi:hypothetical protein